MCSATPGYRHNASTAPRVRAPRDVLRDDHMLPRAMTAKELARRTGLPVGRIRGVLMGDPIDVECAVRFATVFGTPALYWVVLQTEFDMERVRRKHGPGGLGVL